MLGFERCGQRRGTTCVRAARHGPCSNQSVRDTMSADADLIMIVRVDHARTGMRTMGWRSRGRPHGARARLDSVSARYPRTHGGRRGERFAKRSRACPPPTLLAVRRRARHEGALDGSAVRRAALERRGRRAMRSLRAPTGTLGSYRCTSTSLPLRGRGTPNVPEVVVAEVSSPSISSPRPQKSK